MATPSMLARLLALPPTLRRSVWTSAALTATNPEIFDVVCVGGGPAGLSLISALQTHPATHKLKVALIDSQNLSASHAPNDSDNYSNRCSSLTPSSVRFIRQIGAWDHVNRSRTQPYHAMDVWDGVSGSKIHFDPVGGSGGLMESMAALIPGNRFSQSRRKYEMSVDEGMVATMCENSNLTSSLLQRLADLNAQKAEVELLDKSRVESIQLGPEPENEESLNLSQWPIVHVQGRHLAARLLVGADGANSPVRTFADIPSQGWDYNQHGVVATLHLDHTSSPQDLRTAYQRFLPTGPIALLPLPNNRASLVWSTTPQHAAKLKSLSPSDFIATVNAAFRLIPIDIDYMLTPSASNQADELAWRLPNTNPISTGLPSTFPTITAVQEGSIASFPLRMRHASTYTGDRVALIGDAAHTIHPLAGQGLNLGLADAESLAKQLAYGIEHGMDIGSAWCLDGYNSDRWAANHAVLGVVDKLQKVYSASAGPVVWGRSAGVEVLERLGVVKGLVMGAAAGRG